MFKKWHLAAVLVLGVATFCLGQEVKSNKQDNHFLALVLMHPNTDGRYAVVDPLTGLSNHDQDAEEIQKTKAYIKQHLKIEGYDLTSLVDNLFARNIKTAQLTLQSSPDNGYVVDYSGKFTGYFKKNGGGWEKWYKENPKAQGITKVSLPSFDEEKHIVLVYIGTQSHWLSGAGFVIAYKFENDKLTELGSVQLWIS